MPCFDFGEWLRICEKELADVVPWIISQGALVAYARVRPPSLRRCLLHFFASRLPPPAPPQNSAGTAVESRRRNTTSQYVGLNS